MHTNATDTNKSLNTIPSGVWESSRPEEAKNLCTTSTDLQGNGYPKFSSANISESSINKITSLEKELSAENNENIVLVAYRSDEPTT